MSEPTKLFRRGMTGGPSFDVGDVDGAFISLLKACLIDGFNTTAPTGATYDPASKEVTLTYGTLPGYQAYDVIEVSGANEAEYNGEYRVVRTDGNDVVYRIPTAPSVNTATGTLSVKIAPMGGWQIDEEDAVAHKIAFSRTDPGATPYTLIITNNGNQGDFSAGNEFMALAESSEDFVSLASYTAVMSHFWPAGRVTGNATWDPGERWWLVGDHLGFFFTASHANSGRPDIGSMIVWGDFESVMADDTHGLVSAGLPSGGSHEWDVTSDTPHTRWHQYRSTDLEDKLQVARGFSGAAGAQDCFVDHWGRHGTSYDQNTVNPNGPTAAPVFHDIWITEKGSSASSPRHLRGRLPGLFTCSADPEIDGTVLENVAGSEGPGLLFLLSDNGSTSVTRQYMFDLGPWRA